MSEQKLIPIPPKLARLREPWFRKGINPDIESWIRRGAQPIVEPGLFFNAKSILLGSANLKGTYEAVTPPQVNFDTFYTLAKAHYMLSPRNPRQKRSAENAKRRLGRFLAKMGTDFSIDKKSIASSEIPKEAFGLALEVLSILPRHHLANKHFLALKFGGYSTTAYGISTYANGTVHLPTELLIGPRRNFMGMLLYQMGEVFAKLIPREDFERITQAATEAKECFTIDYLFGPEYNAKSQGEAQALAAENYVNYVVIGKGLENSIKGLPNMDKMHFGNLYDTYRDNFMGIEYI